MFSNKSDVATGYRQYSLTQNRFIISVRVMVCLGEQTSQGPNKQR